MSVVQRRDADKRVTLFVERAVGARSALHAGVAVARALDARLVIGVVGGPIDAELLGDVEQMAAEPKAGVDIEWRDRLGPLSEAVAALESKDEALRIVVRPHFGGLDPGWENVIRHSPCPVLVLPHDTAFSPVGCTLVVLWDDSDSARHAVQAAAALGHLASRTVLLTAERYTDDQGAASSARDLRERLSLEGRQVDVRVLENLEMSRVPAALLQAAAQYDAGLIVMGAYGHGVLQERWLGGVTRFVLHHAPIPVLLSH